MSGDDELLSLRREVETLRGRVFELQRAAAKHEPAEGISLAEREELLAEAERIAHLGTWTWNVEDGRVSWSPEFYRIVGRDPDTVVPSVEAFFDAVYPDDRARVQAASEQGVRTGVLQQIEYRVQRPSGEIRHVTMTGAALFDDSGKLRRIVGGVLDLTEARQAAELTQQIVEGLEEAQAIGKLGSWVLNLRNDELRWSKEFVRILGLPASVAPSNAGFLACLHPDDRERFAVIHAHVLETGDSVETEGRVLRPDGELRHIRVNGVGRRDAQGKLVSLRGTMLDITGQVRFREDLARAQKMEAVGRLAGGIAHDFNNLLTVIGTNLDLLRESLPTEPSEVDECLRALDSAATLTRRLLAFGRKAQLVPRVVDPNALVKSTLALLRRLVGDQITLRADLTPGLPAIRVDPIEVERALINLVVNARDALADGGRVWVATRVGQWNGNTTVEISVRDNGPGLDEVTRSRVFEPFFTTKPEGEGSGLGLATVLGTAEQHGGTVRVECPAEGGTTFHLVLPAVSAQLIDSAGVDRASSSTSATSGTRQTVLVVDDERTVASVIERCLVRVGYDVRVAVGPAQAHDIWQREGAEIDLIICDIVMAELRGPQLVRKLAEQRALPPVLFITGYSEEMVQADLEHPVLTKPFSLAALAEAVSEALASRVTITRSARA